MKEIIAKLIMYESGKLNEEETINLFQKLIDEGLLWKIAGKYGKVATKLIAEGKITQEPRPKTIRQIEDLFE